VNGKARRHWSVTERRDARFAWLRAGALGCSIAAAALAVTSCAGAPSTSPVSTAGAPVHSGQAGDRARAVRVRMVAVRDTFAACEQRLEAARGGLPTMAVVGASYTAGVGPDKPALSWAADLARNLRWDAVIYGVSGAGYVQTGTYGAGPMARQLGAEQLPGLSPSLVIVQAGYDDVQVPPGLERRQVDRTIKLIRTEAPHAAIGLVTVFASTARPIPAGFYHIDATIVAAARAADPNAIIMDPLAGQWTYQHAHHGLHPTVAGDAWIAGKVGAILHAHGIASHPGGAAPIICDAGVAGSISAPDSDPRA
jgi:lysophospholipase L1-like esterase